MKKGLTYLLVAGVLTVSFATASFAMKSSSIKGEVTKIEGDMVTVKDDHGKEHTLHVDQHATKKEGEIKVGAHVEADAEANGHAKSIKAGKSKAAH